MIKEITLEEFNKVDGGLDGRMALQAVAFAGGLGLAIPNMHTGVVSVLVRFGLIGVFTNAFIKGFLKGASDLKKIAEEGLVSGASLCFAFYIFNGKKNDSPYTWAMRELAANNQNHGKTA